MKVSNTSERLKDLMKIFNLRQVDILEKTKPFCDEYNLKMNKSDISQYVSGLVEPGQEKLFVLAKALNVNEAWLMGYDVSKEIQENNSNPTTIAAHHDSYCFTEEELEEIEKFKEYIKSKRNK